MLKKILIAVFTFGLPVLALAAGEGPQSDLGPVGTIIRNIINIITNILTPAIFALAFLVFIWGVFVYFVYGGGNEEQQATGKKFMLYGIAGFVIMLSVWGIVNVIAKSLNLTGDLTTELPKPPTSR